MTSMAAMAQARMIRDGQTSRLVVDGNEMIILGGELGNSSASSAADINRIFPQLKQMGLNTVLVPAYWDLMEPTEGNYDFSLTDQVISSADANDLKVVFLWFGAWKNSMSCYAPLWFKTDYKRFPRAMTASGKPLEIASAFSDEVFRADSRAFTAWVQHIKTVDKRNTVIMLQIENEIGMLEDARDHSPVANKAFEADVPEALIASLKRNKALLHPVLAAQWEAAGQKSCGSWAKVFGASVETDEIFMAWHYARYVERLAQIARRETSLPLYVNAAMNSRGRRPGQYPSAGPLAHLKDVWHAAAPTIDMLCPDIYDSGFEGWIAQYALADNQLFVPEMKRCAANGVQAFYAIAEHDAIGVSPFSIENGSPSDPLTPAYATLRQLMPIISQYRGTGRMHGLLFDQANLGRQLSTNKTLITARHFFTLPWDPRATSGEAWPAGGGLIIEIANDEYIIAGSGIVVEFSAEGEDKVKTSLGEDGFALAGKQEADKALWGGTERIGIGFVDQVEVLPDGSLHRLRRLNGDEDHQGRHARIGVDSFEILHVKLYRYK